MVSVIILVKDKLEMTKQCLESLFENTSIVRTTYEVIVVDNGSKDGTTDYLKGLEKEGTIKAIYNKENVGFPAGNNQAAKIAQGEFLCLLNNDTILTKGWLEKLMRVINSDPQIAAVGPYTSHSSGYQAVGNYPDIQHLQEYAQNVTLPQRNVDFLVFFCCLVKRRVWDELGGLDEDFTPGNYEDDYFCYRAIEKGYKLTIANCYIHHFGGASFGYKKEGSPEHKKYFSLIAKNQKKFYHKIGKYKKISLCVICGDFEPPANLNRMLESAVEFVDEVCIVFNYKWVGLMNLKKGKLPTIAKSFCQKGCEIKMFYTKWTNFSDMRNKSFDMATGDWILWMDCDDILGTPQGLRDVIRQNEDTDIFRCQVQSIEGGHTNMILQPRLVKNEK